MMDKLLSKRQVEIQTQELFNQPFAEVERGQMLITLLDFGRIVKHNNFIAAVSMLENQFKNLVNYFEREKPDEGRFQ